MFLYSILLLLIRKAKVAKPQDMNVWMFSSKKISFTKANNQIPTPKRKAAPISLLQLTIKRRSQSSLIKMACLSTIPSVINKKVYLCKNS